MTNCVQNVHRHTWVCEIYTRAHLHTRSHNDLVWRQLSFRSYYFPVKDVIDGDLCETFLSLDKKRQKAIAEDLDRTPGKETETNTDKDIEIAGKIMRRYADTDT